MALQHCLGRIILGEVRPTENAKCFGRCHIFLQDPPWLIQLGLKRSAMTLEFVTNVVAVISGSGHAGYLPDRTWEGLPVTC